MQLEEKNIQDMKKKMTRKTQRQIVMKIIYQMSITGDYSKVDNIYVDYRKKDENKEIDASNIEDFDNIDHIKKLISDFSASHIKDDFDIEEISSNDGKILYKNSGRNEYFKESLEEYDDIDYLKNMMDLFIKNRQHIDEQIEKLLFNTWKIGRLSKIDLAILRTAILDIEYMNIPYKVAINEALNMAKEYSDEKSSSFINGVLKEYAQNSDREIEK
ncbi:transcription antitermination factor NusB [Peptoanaerobacter stomatis]|uniref:Transcription antitermination protein NusB n=1 Tax=Peptoanaerobacter stomatis TaxID=796937 RepID=J6H3M2_9FIRM|nr:transcription antitermination factor NusB [Peptoanaerobacter stomatis]EHL17639.1 transcription antitermination factor NusB [Peptoanaerobacter stomatis]EJU19975.1 putative transcription antitermination factor NusB [Peptoanaerobacter stomatis]NWO25075.1 transcription antitermination factor NusB [Peptostreptococcaceae bacterium oral taxon 081]